MKLRASVTRATGATAHYIGRVDSDGKIEAEPAPLPACVEIHELEGGWLLMRIDANGDPITDTWHPSSEGAKEQTRFEYEIEDGDWAVVRAPTH